MTLLWAAPHEVRGGVHGRAELLEALADPTREEHGAMVVWSSNRDPEGFDRDEVNPRMQAPCCARSPTRG